MGFTYEFLHPEHSRKIGCKFIFEVYGLALKDRSKPQPCPVCGIACKKIISRVNFNEIFPGSTKRESLANFWTKKSTELQEEGFQSKTELETAIGLAEERAKQMGKPDKKLIGPVESPYTGTPYAPSRDEVATADKLVRNNIKAAHSGDSRQVTKARDALNEHEKIIRQKVRDSKKFDPKTTRPELKKQIKESQEARRA